MNRFAIQSGRFVLVGEWTSGAPQLRRNAEQVARTGVDVLADLHRAEQHVAELLGRPLDASQRCRFREAIRQAHARTSHQRHPRRVRALEAAPWTTAR